MIRIGKIVATHGLAGSVIMTHVVGDSKWVTKGVTLMVEMQKGSLIPYFIDNVKSANAEECVLNLEEVDKIDAAKKLVTKHVYVNEDILAGYSKSSPLLWIGFGVTDVHKGLLGTIDDVMQSPGQWLGKVIIDGSEVLIPLITPILKDVNLRSKRIIVEMPEGLVDMYLGN